MNNQPYTMVVPFRDDFQIEFYLDDIRIPRQSHIYPPHVHDNLELYILLEGDVSFAVEDKLYKVKPGDCIVTKPNEIHNCILNGTSPHRHFCSWFAPNCDFLFSGFLAHTRGCNNLCSPCENDREEIFRICRELHDCVADGNDRISGFSYAVRLLALLARNLPDKSDDEPIPELLTSILNDIGSNLSEIRSLSYFTEKYFISQSTLNRLFRKYLFSSPKLYLETKRLAYSRILLSEGKSVTEACFSSGFGDCSNYIRLFKNRFHTTPYKYRSSVR